jgi:hypothetical protein
MTAGSKYPSNNLFDTLNSFEKEGIWKKRTNAGFARGPDTPYAVNATAQASKISTHGKYP